MGAQGKTGLQSVGASFLPSWDYSVQVPDMGKTFRFAPQSATIGTEVALDFLLKNGWHFYTGYRFKQHWLSFSYPYAQSSIWNENTHSIPVRLGLTRQLGNRKLLRRITVGASAGVLVDWVQHAAFVSGGTFAYSFPPDFISTATDDYSPKDINRVNMTLSPDVQGEIGIRLWAPLEICLGYGYTQGIRKLAIGTYRYSVTNAGVTEVGTGKMFNRGSYRYLKMGLRYSPGKRDKSARQKFSEAVKSTKKSKFAFGVSVLPFWDYSYQTNDMGEAFWIKEYPGGQLPINIDLDYRIAKRFELESGFRVKKHHVAHNSLIGSSSTWIETTHSIPLKVRYAAPELWSRIMFSVNGGLMIDLMQKSVSKPAIQGYKFIDVNNPPGYYYESVKDFRPEDVNQVNHSLSWDGQAEIDFRLLKSVQLCAGYGFTYGLKNLAKGTYSASYQSPELSYNESGTMISRGRYSYVKCGLRFIIGH